MNQPLVSVLIVTYNAERYIAATLQSCLAQSYTSLEILILDNGSSDQTVQIIKGFTDQRIRFWPGPANIGPYRGLNYLLDQAQGDYVAIQDHDDLWLPDKIQTQVALLEQHQEYIACGTLTYYYYEQRGVLVLPPNAAVTNFVDHTSLVFRRQAFRYTDRQALPDEHFERVVLRRHGQIACVQRGLTVHRVRRDRQNLSTQRLGWNPRGAREHLRLTHGRDIAGTALFLLTSILPDRAIWWIRRHITLRRATWLDKNDFERQNALAL